MWRAHDLAGNVRARIKKPMKPLTPDLAESSHRSRHDGAVGASGKLGQYMVSMRLIEAMRWLGFVGSVASESSKGSRGESPLSSDGHIGDLILASNITRQRCAEPHYRRQRAMPRRSKCHITRL